MRRIPLACLLAVGMTTVTASSAGAEPLAETLVGSWTCQAREDTGQGESAIAMTLTYRRSDHFLIGEIVEDNGAALLDVWLDNANRSLIQRRIVSYDATIQMELVEEAPTWMKLEGELHHALGTTSRVREEFRFTGSEEFRAIWEADTGDGWEVVMDRTCRRV